MSACDDDDPNNFFCSRHAQDMMGEPAHCIRLAEAMIQRGKPGEALAIVDKLLIKGPSDPGLLHLRGRCLEGLGNLPAAFATFMSALAIDASHLPSLMSVGALYRGRAMLGEALAALSRAHELAPGQEVRIPSRACRSLARHEKLCAIAACQSPSSCLLTRDFISHFPPTADASVSEALALVLGDLGTKLKAYGTTQEAIERYQQALVVCPTCATVHYNMGVITSEMKQYDEALQHYEQAVKLQPGNPQAHCNMGVIYKERGDIYKAITCYERALAASPNFVIVKV